MGGSFKTYGIYSVEATLGHPGRGRKSIFVFFVFQAHLFLVTEGLFLIQGQNGALNGDLFSVGLVTNNNVPRQGAHTWSQWDPGEVSVAEFVLKWWPRMLKEGAE